MRAAPRTTLINDEPGSRKDLSVLIYTPIIMTFIIWDGELLGMCGGRWLCFSLVYIVVTINLWDYYECNERHLLLNLL